jgi:two-component system sensor kinase FixL
LEVELQKALGEENRRFRELFRQAPGFLAIGRTSDYRFEFVNDAYQNLMGDRQLVGRPVAEAVPEAKDQGFMALLYEVERTGEPFFAKDMLFRIERPSGEWDERYLDFIYQPIKDENGRVTGILCSGNDVTLEHMEKVRADKLQKQLSHAARISVMGTMASTLAHEINQPLAAASNYLTGIGRILETLEGERRSAAIAATGKVGQQIQRAGEIIRRARNLLSGRAAARQVIDIEVLAERTFQEVASTDLCPGIQLETEIAPGARHIHADVVQIEQVMINLLRNACQAMATSEHKDIRVATSLEDGRVQVRITDLGPGLPPERRDTIFAEFGKSSTGGLGVGLALSRTIIEAHGGRIWAEAGPGGGATFAFELPAQEPESRRP